MWSCVLLMVPGLLAGSSSARPIDRAPRNVELIDTAQPHKGLGTAPGSAPGIASLDTTWIADWTFDVPGGGCDMTGWETKDMHIQNDGELHWSVDGAFDGTGGITGNAAVVGDGSPCWEYPTGYGNDWYEAIRIVYSGSGWLSFDYLLDAEPGFDQLRVEVDENCASYDLVDFEADPWATSRNFRDLLWGDSGLQWTGRVDSLPIPDFGSMQTHCLYIAFESDGSWSPEDGLYPPTLGAGLVVDNVELVGVDVPVLEDFEQALHPAVSFFDMHESTPFGLWARLYPGPEDNDPCVDSGSCAWIFTDPTLPATDSTYAFGPGGFVTRPRLDNAIISPWVSLAGLPLERTILSYRAFGGTDWFGTSLTVEVAVRGRQFVAGDSVLCTSSWASNFTYDPMHRYEWRTFERLLDSHIDPDWDEIQVRLRVGNHWCPGAGPCTIPTGPGPYIDRVRIGRFDWCGPEFVTSNPLQYIVPAQDAFPTRMDSVTGHVVPDDIFGTVAFSGANVWPWSNPVVPGDSIVVTVGPGCTGAPITSVEWYGAIVAGPHVNKAPPPYAVGGNGFFQVPTQVDGNGHHFIDLDDDYFRGGDVLQFFWVAQDANGGFTSFPPGLSQLPGSIAEAQRETEGLFEWNALPIIYWSPQYLQRIVADPSGKLEPTAQELAGSSQKNCLLYAQQQDPTRRGGQLHRTPLMYMLDILGYIGQYDVYDRARGINNPLASRLSVEQAAGYQLILYDTGNQRAFPGSGVCFTPLLSDSVWACSETVNQARWFREWLDNAPQSDLERATLWLFGSNIAEERSTHPLLADDMGVTLVAAEQNVSHHPDIVGQTVVTWFDSASSDFTGNRAALEPGCGVAGSYDAIEATGTATVSHRYVDGPITGAGAMVVNSNPSGQWNTILSAFAWPETRDADGVPEREWLEFLAWVMAGVVDHSCIEVIDPTDAPPREMQQPLPLSTVLHPNQPNPSNPETTIRFDLARDGVVSLTVYDVAGRRVRTLVNEQMTAGFDKRVRWNGRDDNGRAVASGVYVTRLEAGTHTSTRKIVLIK